MANTPLRRLIDLPGIAELEDKALMKPRYADDDGRSEFPEIDECSSAVRPNRAVEHSSISGNSLRPSSSA